MADSVPAVSMNDADAPWSPIYWALPVLTVSSVFVVGLAARVWAISYGADNDTWLMLGTWDGLLEYGRYVPSRFQGSPIAEIAIGGASWLGGYRLSNSMSALLAVLVTILLFKCVNSRLKEPWNSALLVSIVCLSTPFAISAVTSHDYIYGLAGFLAGLTLMERFNYASSPAVAGALFGIAGGARASYLVLGVVVLLLIPVGWNFLQRALGVVALLTVGTICYVPAYLAADSSLQFVGATRPTGQGLAGVVSRTLVKPTQLLGLPGSILVALLVVACAWFLGFAGARRALGAERHLVAVVCVSLVLWVYLPAEPAYLLPAMAALAIISARALGQLTISRKAITGSLAAVVLITAASNIATVDFLKVEYSNQYGLDSCGPTEATGANIGVVIEEGPLVAYPKLVEATRPCNEALRAQQAELAGVLGTGT